jgi:hypothetical protein
MFDFDSVTIQPCPDSTIFKTDGARHSSRLSLNLVLRLVQRPGKEEIVVPLGAILASERPQQGKRKNKNFK